MKKILFSLLALILCPSIRAQRLDSLINEGWKFRFSYQVQKNSAVDVRLPHTWNAEDALSGKPDYYRGIGNYYKSLDIPEQWKGKRIFLKFDGANTTTDVLVNGKFIGNHRGGYTAFVFELTDRLNYGAQNQIWVRVNNAPRLDIMPLVGDFNFYGGIYRDVHLIVTDDVCISPLNFASDGVYLRYGQVSADKAELTPEVLLTNGSGQSRNVELRVNIDDNGKIAASARQHIEIRPNTVQQSVKLPMQIRNPRFWDGKRDPFLYGVSVQLMENGRCIDEVRLQTGVRTFSVDAERGFFLNGRHLPLYGVATHQERAGVGNALTREMMAEDFRIMNEMGVNAIRMAHYPYAPRAYALADSLGFITWTEIPFVGPGGYDDKGFIDKAEFKESGRQQLTELIHQRFNHPSICFWGLFNELTPSGDDPIPFVEELNRLAHQMDSSRLTTAASNQYDTRLNHITDVVAWNRYDGWYSNEPATLQRWLEREHSAHPELRIGISEYGAGGSLQHQEAELKRPIANSYWHPEGWQTYFHIENWKIIRSHPFVWGSFIWNMFDFGAAHRTEGDRPGINDKGLVSHDRRERKDAYYFYQANWSNNPMLYIADRRVEKLKDKVTDIRVFTNLKRVTLYVDGRKIATMKPDDYHIATFSGVELAEGRNNLEVKGKTSDGRWLTDTCHKLLER